MSFINNSDLENLWCCIKDCQSNNNKENQWSLFSFLNESESVVTIYFKSF